MNRPRTLTSELRRRIVLFFVDDHGTVAAAFPTATLTSPERPREASHRYQGTDYAGKRRSIFQVRRKRDALSTVAPLVAPAGNLTSRYQRKKRLVDLAGASFLLVALSPLMLTVLLVLTATTRGRPLFSQERVGLCGRRFRMWKFRTMRLDADRMQHLVPNEKDGPIFKNRVDPRITKIGRILRKTSIDELPQLFNVLRGEMSLVGPRPPVPKEVEKYKRWQKRRLAVKPGLTCKWQISGRSDVAFEDSVRMDLWYVKNQDLQTDLNLLVRTPVKVVTGEGAY